LARQKLTDVAVKALRPAAKGARYELWDSEMPGLGVRVSDKDTCTFLVMRWLPGHGKPVRFSLGTYPDMKSKAARSVLTRSGET
jgi:hypothetical protein